MKFDYQANGKLLLSGEYFVLDGAKALALPTQQGQSMTVTAELGHSHVLQWRSLDTEGNIWFSANFNKRTRQIEDCNDKAVGQRLEQILRAIYQLNPHFLGDEEAIRITTHLDFPQEWGLGTSSTLLHNLAQWATVDAFELLRLTFGGSGYDLACAGAKRPILFQRRPEPHFEEVFFDPIFKNHLFFVYLGKKQNSREGIARYRAKVGENQPFLVKISELTERFLEAVRLEEFDQIIREHEAVVSATIDLPRAKKRYFSDFWGEVKSLGAWGGDFVLATSATEDAASTQAYFAEKGFEVCLPYDALIR